MDGWHGTRCMDWDCRLFGKVPHVRIGMEVSSCSNQLKTGSWNV
jgi:hypothetical protein